MGTLRISFVLSEGRQRKGRAVKTAGRFGCETHAQMDRIEAEEHNLKEHGADLVSPAL